MAVKQISIIHYKLSVYLNKNVDQNYLITLTQGSVLEDSDSSGCSVVEVDFVP